MDGSARRESYSHNSLLECLVISAAAAEAILRELPATPTPIDVQSWDETGITDSDEEVVVSHNWHELRQLNVGLRGHRSTTNGWNEPNAGCTCCCMRLVNITASFA